MDKSLEWPGEADGPKGILRHGRWPNAAVSTLSLFVLPLPQTIRGHARSMSTEGVVQAVSTAETSASQLASRLECRMT